MEPETDKIARLERENCAFRERLLDLASMLDKSKLVQYMENKNILELGQVCEEDFDSHQKELDEDLEEDHDSGNENCSNVMEESMDSAIDTRSCRLMNFHAPPAKLDTISIDDLNDDFDPRSNESLEVEILDDAKHKSTPGLRNPMTTPTIKQTLITPQSHPSRTLPPPSIPPRDLSRIQATPSITPPVISCPFGMNYFDNHQVLFSSPSSLDFSLDELDPLKN